MKDTSFEMVQMGNVRLYVYSTDKFKTHTLMAMIPQELSSHNVTRTALLPSLLLRGNSAYPDTLSFRRKLEDLYGATLTGSVFKRGEKHILRFRMELADSKYLHGADSLLEDGIRFLGEVLMNPLVEDEGFRPSYIEAEKKNLRQKIVGLVDDKIRYAYQRMIACMCEGEPYSLYNHGRLEDLEELNSHNMYDYYQELLATRPLDLFFVGNIDVDELVGLIEKHFPHDENPRNSVELGSVIHPVTQIKTVVEEQKVNQGKLNIGCRTQTSVRDKEYVPLLMYNGILGSFPHSKLFVNVREKASLAYYASSRLDNHKGILGIQTGIEISNYQQAVDIIKQQLQAMTEGNISDEEIHKTKASLANYFREQLDSPSGLIEFHYNGILGGVQRKIPDIIDEIYEVTREDIQNVAEKVQLDTIYFLRDEKEEVSNGTNRT